MEIIIHESEIGSIGQITNIQNNADVRDYWGTTPTKISTVTNQEIRQARSAQLNYLEILIKRNILNPETVRLSHESKKRRPFSGQNNIDADRIVMGDGRVLDRPAFTDISQTARLLGRDTEFRFRFPLSKLRDIQEVVDWHYTLCKNGESVALMLYYNSPLLAAALAVAGPSPIVVPNPGGVVMPGPPPSHGVKIPGGAQAQ